MTDKDAAHHGAKNKPGDADPIRSESNVSDRIRSRLLAARQRFHANDNIARYIEPGDSTRSRKKCRRAWKTSCERS